MDRGVRAASARQDGIDRECYPEWTEVSEDRDGFDRRVTAAETHRVTGRWWELPMMGAITESAMGSGSIMGGSALHPPGPPQPARGRRRP